MKQAATLTIGLVVAAMGMFGADSSVGTWKLNVAKSKTNAANPAKSQTDVREATPDGGSKMTRTSQLADGSSANYSISFKYDGKPNAVKGAPYDVIAVKRIDANTTSFDVKKTGGKYHVTGQNVISKDGKMLTQTASGTAADGKPLTSMMIFDKQ